MQQVREHEGQSEQERIALGMVVVSGKEGMEWRKNVMHALKMADNVTTAVGANRQTPRYCRIWKFGRRIALIGGSFRPMRNSLVIHRIPARARLPVALYFSINCRTFLRVHFAFVAVYSAGLFY